MARKKNIKKRKGYKKKRAPFMSRGLALKRADQVSTKVFYFKGAGKIAGNPLNQIIEDWATVFFQTAPTAQVVPNIPGDFDSVSDAYQEYKVLAVRVTLYAANVGSRSAAAGIDGGMVVIYKDQEYINPATQPPPTQITDVINNGSCKVIPSRVSKWTSTIYRASGNPEWGNCDRNTPPNARIADSWRGVIHLLGQGVSNAVTWYYTTNYKVVFRGRTYV